MESLLARKVSISVKTESLPSLGVREGMKESGMIDSKDGVGLPLEESMLSFLQNNALTICPYSSASNSSMLFLPLSSTVVVKNDEVL